MENVLLSSGRRKPQDLRPHPLNEEIYGDRTDADLIKSISEKGVLNPLLITHDNRIISGHRRWGTALAINMDIVPIVVFGSQDELDIQEALIESNRQREKTNEQKSREVEALTKIYHERESRQGANQFAPSPIDRDKNGASALQSAEAKPPSQKAADVVGWHRNTATKASAVVKAIDKLKKDGKTDQAEKVRKKLNTNINGAYSQAKSEGILVETKPKVEPQIRNFITLAEWNNADSAHQRELPNMINGKSEFNKTNDNIEWAAWSWNPVTGCLHNCPYCYARDIANHYFTHLGEKEDRFSPVFYPDRLSAPGNTKQPNLDTIADPIGRMAKRNVFVCSMADLFGKWVPTDWIEKVLQQAWDNPQWTFLFLTKFPIRMAEFEYPPNTWIGTTVDSQYAVERAEKAFRKVRAGGYEGVAWLSCEPMMERLTFTEIDMFDWVVVGGSSKSTQTAEFKPPFEWTVHLWNQAKLHNLPVYMKTNLGIENDVRVREYPGQP